MIEARNAIRMGTLVVADDSGASFVVTAEQIQSVETFTVPPKRREKHLATLTDGREVFLSFSGASREEMKVIRKGRLS